MKKKPIVRLYNNYKCPKQKGYNHCQQAKSGPLAQPQVLQNSGSLIFHVKTLSDSQSKIATDEIQERKIMESAAILKSVHQSRLAQCHAKWLRGSRESVSSTIPWDLTHVALPSLNPSCPTNRWVFRLCAFQGRSLCLSIFYASPS